MGALRVAARPNAPVKRRRFGAAVLLAALLITVAGLWVDRFLPFERWAHGLLHPAPAQTEAVPRVVNTGAINVVQPQPLGTDSSVSRVPLPLVLTGTRRGRNVREGYADIGVNALSPQTYRAGALLANGARLEEIYSDYVVLARDSHHARLYVTGRAVPADAPPPYLPLLTVGGATQTVKAAVADSHDRLTEIIRVSPVYEGDTLQALEVYGSGSSDTFARLGLEPGDRVTAIEGASLKNPGEAIAQLRRLVEGASLTVTVERGGKRQTLSLDGSVAKSRGTRG